jgi:hypothetical protein
MSFSCRRGQVMMLIRVLLPCLFLLMALPVSTISAADPETAKIAGSYSASGEDISGAKYTARVEITTEGDSYRVNWKYTDGSEFIGIGLREGKTLSVSWAGQAGPGKIMVGVMVYTINKNGTMEGKWTILGAKGKVKTESLAPIL